MGFIVPPSKWEIQHAKQIFAAQNYQAANNGQLPDTRAWRMLEFRHDLNPTRFGFFPPNIALMIEAQNITPPGDPGTDPPIDPPITPPVDPPTGGQEITPPPPNEGGAPTVPEPASFLMLIVALLTVGLCFQRARRRAR